MENPTTYILNGVRTHRFVYPGVTYTPEHDLSDCEVCHSVTKPYYCLTEDGSVYVTNPDGTVYYLDAQADTFVRRFPINSRLTAESLPPGLEGLHQCGGSTTSITICWINGNEQGENWEHIMRPQHGHLVPWRPGRSECGSIQIQTQPNQEVQSFLIPAANQFINPKNPRIMEMPYCNGYYVIQDGQDHCVVFYRGVPIYEGRYNGMGIPAKFAYGVKFCNLSGFCCPVTASCTWEQPTMLQKWRQKDNKYVCTSAWDRVIAQMQVNEDGEIMHGNVLQSTVFDANFNPATDTVVLQVLSYIVDDSASFAGIIAADNWITLPLALDERLCNVYKNAGIVFCGVVAVSDSGQIRTIWNSEFLANILMVIWVELDAILANDAAKRTQIIQLRQECNTQKIALSAAQARLRQIEAQINNTGDENVLQTLQEELKGIENEINDTKTEIANIRIFIKELVQSYADAIYSHLDSAKTARQIVVAMLNGERTRLDANRYDIEELRRHQDEYTSAAFQAQLAQLEETQDEIQGSISNYESEIQSYDTLIDDLQEQVDEQARPALDMLTGIESLDSLSETTVDADLEQLNSTHRILWSLKYNDYWASGLPEERTNGVVILDCDYEMVFRCVEEETYQQCEGIASTVQHKTWYEGTGFNVSADDSRFKISKWMEECCKTCYPSKAGLFPCSEYSCGGGCGCDAPAHCGTCYPLSGGTPGSVSEPADDRTDTEPVWRHLPRGQCDPSLRDKLIQFNPTFCEDYNPVYQEGTVCVPNLYCVPTYDAYIQTCPDKDTEGETPEITKEKVCTAEIATAQLEKLGGRIVPVTDSLGEPTDWAYIVREKPVCRQKKDYTIIGEIASAQELPGILKINSLNLPNSNVGTNAVSAFVLRAPHIVEQDARIGFSYAFVRDSDPDELRRHYTKFYPATDVKPEAAEYERWQFVRLQAGCPGSDGELTDTFSWYAVWSAEIQITGLVARKVDQAVAEAYETGTLAANDTEAEAQFREEKTQEFLDEYTNDGYFAFDYLSDEKQPDLYYTKMPTPTQDIVREETGATSGITGKWYVEDIMSREDDIYNPPAQPVPMSENSGTYWKMWLQSWGDPEGLPIRTGLQAGDVFYHKGEYLPDDPDNLAGNEIDVFWHWTGFHWQKGDRPFSEIDSKQYMEIALFYKNSGQMDLRPQTEEEANSREFENCAQAKALFIGKLANISACGELIAINLNADSTHHKILAHNADPIWERLAGGQHYTSSTSEEMQEGMMCLGDTYILATYNTGMNKQIFRMWLQDLEVERDEISGTILSITRVLKPIDQQEYEYEDVPDIFSISPSWVTKRDLDKYGEAVMKYYLIIQSRDKQKLYVFYKGVLKHTYTDGSTALNYGIAGPRYAIIQRSNGCYDIWTDGNVEESCDCSIQLDGAITSCTVQHEYFRVGYHSMYDGYGYNFAETDLQLAFLRDTGETKTWGSISTGWQSGVPVYGDSYQNRHAVSVGLRQGATAGDWTVYYIGNFDSVLAEIEDGDGGKSMTVSGSWSVYKYNSKIQKLESTAGSYAPIMPDGFESPLRYFRCAMVDQGMGPICPGGSVDFVTVAFSGVMYSWSDSSSGATRWNYSSGFADRGCSVSVEDEQGNVQTAAMSMLVWWDNPGTWTSDGKASCVNAIWSDTSAVAAMDGVTDGFSLGSTAATCNHFGGGGLDGSVYGSTTAACCQDSLHSIVMGANAVYESLPPSGGIALSQIVSADYYGVSAIEPNRGIYDTAVANICDCGNIRNCGNYSQYIENDVVKSTYYFGTQIPKTVLITDCCEHYAIFADNTVFYKTTQIATLSESSSVSFAGCCGNGAVVVERDTATGVILAQYVIIDGLFIGDLERTGVKAQDVVWNMSCCGIDYYLIQRGDFEKIKPEVQYTSRTVDVEEVVPPDEPLEGEENPPSPGGIMKKHYYYEDCALGQTLTLENGSIAELIAVQVLRGKTIPTQPNEFLNNEQHQYFYRYERPKTWRTTMVDSTGNTIITDFDHDMSYKFEAANEDGGVGGIITPGGTFPDPGGVLVDDSNPATWQDIADGELQATRTNYVPWQYLYQAVKREAFVYYKTTQVSNDLRIKKIECFRYENMNVTQDGEPIPGKKEDQRATAAYAMFYDDPYNDLKEDNWYQWTTGGGESSLGAPPTNHQRWVREQPVVKDILPLYNLDDTVFNSDSCGGDDACKTRAKIINTYPNVCLIVWERDLCTSLLNHDDDSPMIPFYIGRGERDNEDSEIDFTELRKSIIYVNDYNTAVRFDRLTGHDPVDAWQNGYYENSAGKGDFWVAAPCFNAEQAPKKEDRIDTTGRLVAAGNNSLYVWHEGKTRMEFNCLNGSKILRQ